MNNNEVKRILEIPFIFNAEIQEKVLPLNGEGEVPQLFAGALIVELGNQVFRLTNDDQLFVLPKTLFELLIDTEEVTVSNIADLTQ